MAVCCSNNSVLMKKFFRAAITDRCSRQKCCDNKRQEVVSNFNCWFSFQITCVFALLRSLFAGLNFAFDLSFILVWKWLCICIFFFTTLEVKKWHSEICQLPKYLFFIWTWVASMPRTTSRQFSLVTGAYGPLCLWSWVKRGTAGSIWSKEWSKILHHSLLSGVISLLLLHCRQVDNDGWVCLLLEVKAAVSVFCIFQATFLCLDEIVHLLKKWDAPRGIGTSLPSAIFKVEWIFFAHEQLHQVALGWFINRTEIGTAWISILLLQSLLRSVCDVLNSVLFVQFQFCLSKFYSICSISVVVFSAKNL